MLFSATFNLSITFYSDNTDCENKTRTIQKKQKEMVFIVVIPKLTQALNNSDWNQRPISRCDQFSSDLLNQSPQSLLRKRWKSVRIRKVSSLRFDVALGRSPAFGDRRGSLLKGGISLWETMKFVVQTKSNNSDERQRLGVIDQDNFFSDTG